MKKALLALICIATMLAAVSSLKAQEITITLNPEWNWISYPRADILDFTEAMGSFVPMEGDVIATQDDYAEYSDGEWYGTIEQFFPGWGYMYYSNRTESVTFSFQLQPVSPVTITTLEPTDVTATSAMVASEVTIPEGCHVFLRGLCWGMEPNPDIDGDHIAGDAVAGDQSYSLEGFLSGTTYYVRAYTVTDYGLAYGEELSFTTENGGGGGDNHAYVDLGLPSGTLWATCNVGASVPEEYGDYFAWGETQPKDIYNWETYQHCNGSENTLTKYCYNSNYGLNGFTDELTVLLPEDDAATANWGNEWRMPTKEEWLELYQNTTNSWTTQNGVNGWLYTAENGNSIFLPAAGHHAGDYYLLSGSWGIYWSSSLYTNPNTSDYPYCAWNVNFYSDQYNAYDAPHREYGQSVRPVRSAPQNNTPTGAINGKFTINANGDQVYFSQGNLQYQASTNTWRFAENQWDYVGDGNANISQTYDGWIDLFGWGTSGYNHGAVCYQPWSSINTIVYYYAYGSYTYNLYDQTGQADWGYNVISNGGDYASWRTLTQPEWDYMFNTRNTSSGIRYVKANVNGVNGVILLPDDWNNNVYYLSTSYGFNSNVLTISQWVIIESAGAVFLPAAGCRSATSVGNVGSYGYYWSATYYDSDNAYDVYINDNSLIANDILGRRFYGQSVRLVRDVE